MKARQERENNIFFPDCPDWLEGTNDLAIVYLFRSKTTYHADQCTRGDGKEEEGGLGGG